MADVTASDIDIDLAMASSTEPFEFLIEQQSTKLVHKSLQRYFLSCHDNWPKSRLSGSYATLLSLLSPELCPDHLPESVGPNLFTVSPRLRAWESSKNAVSLRPRRLVRRGWVLGQRGP